MTDPHPHRACTAECLYATTPVETCDCPDCGGANHGAGRKRPVTASTPEAQVKAWSRIPDTSATEEPF